MNDYGLENKIKYICGREYKYFFNKKNVVGVAFGYKVKNAFRIPKKCIAVFVNKKISKNRLNSKELIPKTYKGIDTDVIESGIFQNNSLTERIRPVKGGYVIGSETQSGCGTDGCIVTDGKYYYILTNSHVIDAFYEPTIGAKLLQPSINFGGSPSSDAVAIVSKAVPVELVTETTMPVNYVDCSMSKIIKRSQISTKVALIGRIKGINITPTIGLDVQKVGALSELTKGKITYLNGSFLATITEYEAAFFKDQIITTSMQSSGDSGAILLDNNISAVGLCQGSNKAHTMDIVNSIKNVLSSLNVSIVTG